MSLATYVKILKERWVAIAAIAVLGVVISGGAFLVQPRQYTASTSLFVAAQTDGTADSAYQGGLLSEQRVKSYAELATSDRVRTDVNRQLGRNWTAKELAAKVSASSQLNSVVLQVNATDPDPRVAARLADSVSGVLTELVNELERPANPGAPQRVSLRLVDPAAVPESPSSTGFAPTLLVGLAAGLALGTAFALARAFVDTSIKSAEAIRPLLGAPNLANVEILGAESDIADALRSASISETFRQLRTNLQFIDVDRKPKVIAVTSALPEEGKSTTAANLAVALGLGGHKTILVDGDLRRPRVAAAFGLPEAVGLTNVLAGQLGIEAAVQNLRTQRISILTSGPTPPNPSELLGSNQMAQLLITLRDLFDVVIVDAPPVLPVADAAALAHNCDGAILAVKYGSTTHQQARRAAEALTNVSARVLGSVLTMVPRQKLMSFGYASYYRTGRTATTVTPSHAEASDDPPVTTPTAARHRPTPIPRR
jgi:succinoglycan biosynthesis transport protein ExoP